MKGLQMKLMDYSGLQINVRLDQWFQSVITTPCSLCSSTNATVTNQDITIEGRIATLSMLCGRCATLIKVSNLPVRRLFPERPVEDERKLDQSRQRRRHQQRLKRGWTEEKLAAYEAMETSTRLREWGGKGIIDENLTVTAATLLTGMTLKQHQASAQLSSQLPLARRTMTAHATKVWHAAETAAEEKCRQYILSCRHKKQLRVLIDGGWDHRRDGSHSELIVLDQETLTPFMCIAIAKHCYGTGKDGKYKRTRVGNYDKEHSNGMEGAAWQVPSLIE